MSESSREPVDAELLRQFDRLQARGLLVGAFAWSSAWRMAGCAEPFSAGLSCGLRFLDRDCAGIIGLTMLHHLVGGSWGMIGPAAAWKRPV